MQNGVNCGIIDQGNRIVGGEQISDRSIPWQVMVLLGDDSQAYQYSCGGSIISPNSVLTAAHCTHEMTSLGSGVYYGLDNVDIGNLIPERFLDVSSIKTHELYATDDEDDSIDYDINLEIKL